MIKVYVNSKLPEELSKEVDVLIKERFLGYRSRSEFVTEATRRLLIEVNTLRKEQEIKKPRFVLKSPDSAVT